MRYTTRSAAAGLLAAVAMGATAGMAAEPQLTVNPWFPAYGQAVQVDLRDANTYLPATRYSRTGNTITVDFEYPGSSVATTTRADFGSLPVALGELAPGSYTMRGRLFDLSHAGAAPRIFEQQIEVAPPDTPGVYVVPRFPNAFQPIDVVVKSEYPIDLSSLRASVSGGVVRVDYTYAGGGPANGPPIPGFAPFASVKVAGLSPGFYRVEAVGTDRRWSTYHRSDTGNIAIGTLASVVEYYADSLDHYFISAWPDEVAQLDGSPAPAFKRTGQQFKGWLKAADAPQGAVPVCRFYASGPNSHFYTADPSECQFLKSLEQKQRGDAQVSGEKFGGWQFEAVAFYAIAPRDATCPGDTQPVYRDYNMRGAQNDSNHRFVVNPQLRAAMKSGWSEEGVAFCSPT